MEQKKQIVLAALRCGYSRVDAVEKAGAKYRSLARWCATSPEYREKTRQAEDEFRKRRSREFEEVTA